MKLGRSSEILSDFDKELQELLNKNRIEDKLGYERSEDLAMKFLHKLEEDNTEEEDKED